MKPYKLHLEAYGDLSDIWFFIAKDNSKAAEYVTEAVWDKFQYIADNPNLGHLRDDLTDRLLRFTTVHKYLIGYIPDTDPLIILAIVHGARDPEILRTILETRN